MFILDTHKHKLIFRLHNDAPINYINIWKKIKFDCEKGNNKYIIEKMKTYCKLQSNKNIPYLNRLEGGIGGNDNTINKQIRFFRLYNNEYGCNDNINDIVLDQIINTDTEKWSYDELDDLIYALTKTFNYFLKSTCVNGFIEIVNNKWFSDNYLDSDDEFE